jgi:hypothetical protein
MQPVGRTKARATLYAVLLGAVGMVLGAVAAALLSREIPSGSAKASVSTPASPEAAGAPEPRSKGEGLVVERK